MLRLHLIRHGETADNAAGRFQGQRDEPLSVRGQAQAEALAAALTAWPLTAVVASDLRRAADTACRIAAPHGLEPRLDARWREIDVGAWCGCTAAEAAARWPEVYRRWRAGDGAARLPGGESLDDLMARVGAATAELLAAEGELAVVGHGLALRAAVAHCLGVGPAILARLRLANCAVCSFAVQPGHAPVLCRFNDESLVGPLTAHAPDVGMGGSEAGDAA